MGKEIGPSCISAVCMCVYRRAGGGLQCSRWLREAVSPPGRGGYRYGATPLSRPLICFREPTSMTSAQTVARGTRAGLVDGTGGPDQPKAPGVFPCRGPKPAPCPAAGRTSQKPQKPRNPLGLWGPAPLAAEVLPYTTKKRSQTPTHRLKDLKEESVPARVGLEPQSSDWQLDSIAGYCCTRSRCNTTLLSIHS
jgi:hypothetical protein